MISKLLLLAKKLAPFIWDRLQTVDWASARSPLTDRYERSLIRIGQILALLLAAFAVFTGVMLIVRQMGVFPWILLLFFGFIYYRILIVKPRQFAISIHTLIIDLAVIILSLLTLDAVKPEGTVQQALFYSVLLLTLLAVTLFTTFLSTVARPILLMMQARNKAHAWKQTALLKGRQLQAHYRQMLQRARRGEATGYEPQYLDAVHVSDSTLVHGDPGQGQDLAELNFARALEVDGFLTKFASFWSSKLPNARATQKLKDLDCVLVGKDRVYLIDVLNTLQGERIEGAATKVKQAEQTVRHELQQRGIKLPVSSFVVQMPNADGSQKADLQLEVNGVPVLGVLQMLSVLSKDKGGSWRSRSKRLLLDTLRRLLS